MATSLPLTINKHARLLHLSGTILRSDSPECPPPPPYFFERCGGNRSLLADGWVRLALQALRCDLAPPADEVMHL